MAARLADQVGSFLRPPELLEARADPGYDAERLRALEDRHILRVLGRQKELGFEIYTDGELRRRNFMSDFTDAVEGFDMGASLARTWQAGGQAKAALGVAGVVTSKLRAVRRLTGHELPFLKAHSPGAIKMTLPSATQFPAIAFKRGVTDAAYPDHSALLRDIVDIMKADLAVLSGEGVAYLQIDAPRYSYFMDPKWRDWIRTEMKTEPDALLDESIRADNACLQAARRPGHPWPCTSAGEQSQPLVRGGRLRRHRRAAVRGPDRRPLPPSTRSAPAPSSPLRFVPGKDGVLGLVSGKRPAPDERRPARRITEPPATCPWRPG
jgi:5-methyltetrahydropteroyltriglutamate--homocysteine methyltransferase